MQPPTGADAKWEAKPRLAALLRLTATLTPMLVAAVVVMAVSHALPRPHGWLPVALWWIGLTLTSTLVVTVTERGTRKFLPLVALFRLSLVFPDHAPSRFKVAMRTNTLRQLQRSVADGDLSAYSAGLQDAAEQLVALAGALNAHDRMTRGHTERVRAYSLMIGEELHLPPEDLDRLHWAGLIHDIGKLEVPPAILNKPGRPSEEEWQILQGHPTAGLRLVEPLRPWLGEWADAASQHHERMDGKGYPLGLAGSEISLSGRIVAVADAYDVMTSVRSYKKAKPPEVARAELGRCAGTQFDPEVVRAFLNVSVGKLRLVMGPLSSLAQLPRLADVPLGGAVASGLSAVASVGLTVLSGFLGTSSPAPTELAFSESPPAVAAPGGAGGRTGPAAEAPSDAPTSAPAAEPGADASSGDGSGPSAAAEAVPIADLRLTGREDTAVVVDPAVIAAMAGPTPTSWRVTEVPRHLTLGLVGDTTVLTPDPEYHGTASGRYEACWDERCAEADLDVVVASVNDAPGARPDLVAATSGFETIVNPLTNDSDVDGDRLTVRSVSAPSLGTVTTDGRRLTYTAPPGAAGDTRVTYVVADPDGATASADVTIRVVAAASPDARDDTALVAEDSAPAFLDVIDNDGAGVSPLSTATVRLVGAPAHGAAAVSGQRIVYQPTADHNGPDAVDYEVCDPFSLCDTATLAIDVVAVDDPPTFAASGGRTVAEDAGPVSFAAWATAISPGPADEAAQQVTFDVTADHPELFAGQPAIDPAGNLTFTPAPDAHGAAQVRVVARDDGGTAWGGVDTSEPRTFTLTVTPVNDPVVAGDDTVTLTEDDTAVTFDVTANDTDVDGDTLVVDSIDTSGITGGTVTDLGDGRYSFLPDPDYFGSQTFTYVVDDGQGSTDTGTVGIDVAAVPDDPQARDDGATTDVDTQLVVPAPGLLANDFDVDGTTPTVVTTPVVAPVHGTVTLAADGSYTYTPAAGYVGADEFTYRIEDGTGRTAVARAGLVVDGGLVTTGLYLDTTYNGITWGTRSTPRAAVDPEPDHDADGEPGFRLQKSANNPADLTAATNIGFIHQVSGNTLHLNGPVTLDLWSTVRQFVPTTSAHPLVTLYDCVGTSLACTALGSADVVLDPYNGGVADWVERQFTFGNITHDVVSGHSLVVRVQVALEDLWLAASGSRPSRLTITEANVAPTAVADTVPTMREDAATVNVDVLANDSDTNIDPTSVTIVTAPTKGTAVARPDGTVDYTPAADANGADSFTYRVCDTSAECATASAAVSITAVNDRPTFTGGGDLTILLGAPYNSVWATGSPGPPDEAGQTLYYTVTTDNPSLFTVQPTIAANGRLTFTCGLLSIGTANVTVTLHDTGGTAFGGADTSVSQTFTVTSV